jgi:4,5-dihydroxyphthalate decarboxylase
MFGLRREPSRKLLASFHKNPRVAPLMEGRVEPEGLSLEWDMGDIGEAFMRALTRNDFDVFEFSISHYIATREHANPAFAGWTAVPVFSSKPSGIYRYLCVREASGIKTLADLRGKRIGIPDFSMTGGIAIRVILRILFGIQPQEIAWVNTRPATARHDAAMGFDRPTSNGIAISNIAEGITAQQLIERDEVDAVVTAPNAPVRPAPGIRRLPLDLWVDMLAQVQQAIGVTPANHVLVVQKRLLEERPDVPLKLLKAFERSKAEAYRRDPAARAIFPDFDLDVQRTVFGDDPYPYGTAANRRVLDLVAEQLQIDGFIARCPVIEELVAPAVLDT